MIKVINNDKLKEILTEREVIVNKARELNLKKEKIEKEMVKSGYKMNKLRDKTSKIIDKENIELGEFDIIARVFVEDGECKVEIVDKIEEFKKALREDAKKDDSK